MFTEKSAYLYEEGIKNLTTLISKSEIILGNGKKIKTNDDKKIEKKFRYWLS